MRDWISSHTFRNDLSPFARTLWS